MKIFLASFWEPEAHGPGRKIGISPSKPKNLADECGYDCTLCHDWLSPEDVYWDYFKADQIPDQSLAMYIVDSGLNQGRVLIVKYLQAIIGVEADGHFGPQTFATLLDHIKKDGGEDEYNALHQKRLDRYNAIVASRPDQAKFLKGWINRLNNIKYK